MIKGFKQFILRGNVVDLAVAVVIGAAFGALVTSFVTNVIDPIIGSIFGSTNFDSLKIHLRGHNSITYGSLITAVITFLGIALGVYFLVVVPMNAVAARRAKAEQPAATRECPHCRSEIPVAASVCAFCTRDVVGAA
jgi:large conductance mechanosensitive channel